MPIYTVPVEARVILHMSVEAANMEEAKSEAQLKAEYNTGDAERVEFREVLKIGKPVKWPNQ